MDRLADLGNGLGTTFVASLASLLSFVTYNLISSSLGEFSWRGWLSVVIGLSMLLIHFWNYRGVIQDAKNIFRKILLDEFEDEYHRNKAPVKLRVFKSDLRKRPSNQTAAPM